MQSSAFLIAVFEFVLLLFSLSFHECAHAWMASRLGDQTARLQGRITLNPMYHADPIGTLLFPALIIFGPFFGFTLFSGFLIGWAKPTPVITRNFRKIVRDDNLTTLAGPVSNLILVGVAFTILAVTAVAIPNGRAMVLGSLYATSNPAALPLAHPVALALQPRHFDQYVALLFQPAAHSAARWKPRAAQPAALRTRCSSTTA